MFELTGSWQQPDLSPIDESKLRVERLVADLEAKREEAEDSVDLG